MKINKCNLFGKKSYSEELHLPFYKCWLQIAGKALKWGYCFSVI